MLQSIYVVTCDHSCVTVKCVRESFIESQREHTYIHTGITMNDNMLPIDYSSSFINIMLKLVLAVSHMYTYKLACPYLC